MDRKTQTLQRQIDRIKRKLMRLGDLRPGSLSEQYNVCGTPGCRCKLSPPQKHGPYYQISFTRKGRGSTRFVRREDVTTVKRQLRNYASLRELVDQWIETATELSDLQVTHKSPR